MSVGAIYPLRGILTTSHTANSSHHKMSLCTYTPCRRRTFHCLTLRACQLKMMYRCRNETDTHCHSDPMSSHTIHTLRNHSACLSKIQMGELTATACPKGAPRTRQASRIRTAFPRAGDRLRAYSCRCSQRREKKGAHFNDKTINERRYDCQIRTSEDLSIRLFAAPLWDRRTLNEVP